MKIWFSEFLTHSEFLELHDYLKVFEFYRSAGDFESTKTIIEIMREKKIKTVGETCNQIVQNIALIKDGIANKEQIEAVHSVFEYMIQLNVNPTPTTVNALECFSRYCEETEQKFWQIRLSMFDTPKQTEVKKNLLHEYLQYEIKEKLPEINFNNVKFHPRELDQRQQMFVARQQIFFNSKGLSDENGIPLETIESDIRQIQEFSHYFDEAAPQRRMKQNIRRERNF